MSLFHGCITDRWLRRCPFSAFEQPVLSPENSRTMKTSAPALFT
jgi:hypothetical protein